MLALKHCNRHTAKTRLKHKAEESKSCSCVKAQGFRQTLGGAAARLRLAAIPGPASAVTLYMGSHTDFHHFQYGDLVS